MKILYIDPVSSLGHLNFNRIYINSLRKKATLNFIFRNGYIERLGYEKADLKYTIPSWMYMQSRNKVINRIYMTLQLLCIKLNFSFEQYDYVIISYYEEISFYLSGMKSSNLLLINHRNVSGLNSKVKSFFLKKISDRILSHIVFEEYMKDCFGQNDIKNVKVVSHGLPDAYLLDNFSDSILNSIVPHMFDFRYVIFSPSSSSTDICFIGNLINDKSFCSFLEDNGILLIIKGGYLCKHSRNIFVLDVYIDQIQYETLFLKSDLILMCYPPTFDCCVSGVLFECFSNNKPCLMSNIHSLRCFSTHLNYDSFYDDMGQLKHLILDHLKTTTTTCFYHSLELLQPQFGFLFDKC